MSVTLSDIVACRSRAGATAKNGKVYQDPMDLFMSKVEKVETGCWHWAGFLDRDGYGRFTFSHRSFFAHRVAYALHKGDVPADRCVLHQCDNPKCVNPAHLSLGTQLQNIEDRDQKKRGGRSLGEENGQAKLSREGVKRIRAGERASVLARALGVSERTVFAVRSGKAWGRV